MEMDEMHRGAQPHSHRQGGLLAIAAPARTAVLWEEGPGQHRRMGGDSVARSPTLAVVQEQ